MLDQRYAAAEAVEHLSDLAAHGPAADHHCGRRQLVARVDVLAVPERPGVEARDARLTEPGAGGDDQVAPADAKIAGGQDAGSLDAAARLDQVGAFREQALHRAGVVLVLGHDVAAGHGGRVRLPVAVQRQRTSDGAGGHGRAADALPQLGGRQHRLARDAREVGAFAAHQPFLDQRHALAALRQERRGVFAGRAAAQDYDVVGVHAGGIPLPPFALQG